MSQPSPLEPARQRAHSLAEQGDRAAAVAMLEHAVELGKVNLGEDDPGVLGAAHQLARLHQADDDFSAARRVLEEAYAAGQWRLGEADPLMLEISYDLGVVAEELGNRHEARKALGRVVEAGTPVLGGYHWAVLKAQAYLDGDTSVLRPGAPTPEPKPHPAPQLQAPPEQWPPVQQQMPVQQAQAVQQQEPIRQAWPVQHDMPTQQVQPVHMPAPVDDGLTVQQPLPVQPAWPIQQDITVQQPAPVRQSAPVQDLQAGLRGQTYPVREEARPPEEPTALMYRPVEHRIPAQPTYETPGDAAVFRIQSTPQQAPTAPPPVSSYPKRSPALFAAIAAVLAAAIAVVALVIVLAQRDDAGTGNGPEPDVPTLGGGPAPTDVQVRDYGTSVEITWTDPGQGKNSTIVTGGHPGEVLKPMGEVGPGETRFELRGLNDQLEYCFAVVAVYGTNSFATSPQKCIKRTGPQRSD
ncbi:tetratricopeptide repeat protein [Actinoplanes sp. NPDC051633]|uniref:tetratricopeptide repeat protein n=1 Tax=Actinoplanes sp. NPDC051633 TaxID=3155670 RepID=UPI003417F9A1